VNYETCSHGCSSERRSQDGAKQPTAAVNDRIGIEPNP
jgi:hypothetical protein